MRTNLELYLAASIEMLLLRVDGGNEDAILDKLDELGDKLSPEEVEFTKTFLSKERQKA